VGIGLNLITVVIECSSQHLCLFPSLTALVQDSLSQHLIQVGGCVAGVWCVEGVFGVFCRKFWVWLVGVCGLVEGVLNVACWKGVILGRGVGVRGVGWEAGLFVVDVITTYNTTMSNRTGVRIYIVGYESLPPSNRRIIGESIKLLGYDTVTFKVMS